MTIIDTYQSFPDDPAHRNEDAVSDWLAAIYIKSLSVKQMLQLRKHFDSLHHLYCATRSELCSLKLTPEQIKEIKHLNWQQVKSDMEWIAASDAHHIIHLFDNRYPPMLKEISDPPLVLFVKGDYRLLKSAQIAIVGSRCATPLGRGIAFQLAAAFTQYGLVVTSGLALGIDSAAHEGALHDDGNTIAVTGCGLNHTYPRSNRPLVDKILLQGGAIISEFPLNTPPLARHFPRRNRIIAGISDGVTVIEAALRSGSLITARLAAEFGRDVFAVPGAIHQPLSKGTHQLIKQGAKLVETPEDVLEEILPQISGRLCNKKANQACSKNDLSLLSDNERKVYGAISYELTDFDTIIQQSGLTLSDVSSILLTLELQGRIHITAGGYVRVVPAFS